MSKAIAGYLNFFWAGLAKRGQTGAIMPSQRFLVAKMIAPVPEDYSGRVVELGAGNGALTLRLAKRCRQARILACEINPTLARDNIANMGAAGLSDRVEVHCGSAERLLTRLAESEAQKADFIISGIPLGTISGEKALALIDSIRGALRPGGMYIQFQHSLVDRKRICACFKDVRTVLALLNFPPAFVYFARR